MKSIVIAILFCVLLPAQVAAKTLTIGIDRSTVFAFSDGLSSGELKGMSAALDDEWTAKFKDAEGLPLELIASRLP